jgi:L-ascorbate metabolism protein UlaG (beta-lactamase superfamily)
MFLPIGDNFTMGVDDASMAAKLVKPKVAIPVHYNTWDIIKADPQEFKSNLDGSGINVVILEPNESVEM